jgi:hypothetical protein
MGVGHGRNYVGFAAAMVIASRSWESGSHGHVRLRSVGRDLAVSACGAGAKLGHNFRAERHSPILRHKTVGARANRRFVVDSPTRLFDSAVGCIRALRWRLLGASAARGSRHALIIEFGERAVRGFSAFEWSGLAVRSGNA